MVEDLRRLLPPYRVPIVDANGNCSRPWYIYFQALVGVCCEPAAPPEPPEAITINNTECRVTGGTQNCGAFDLGGVDMICGLPLQTVRFSTTSPVGNPVSGSLFIELTGISAITDVSSITINGLTLDTQNAVLFGDDLAWLEGVLSDAERLELYTSLSNGQPVNIEHTC